MIREILDALDLVAVAFLAALFATAMVPAYAWRLVMDRAEELRRRRSDRRRSDRLGVYGSPVVGRDLLVASRTGRPAGK